MKFKLNEELYSIYYDFSDEGGFDFEPTLDDKNRFLDSLLRQYSKNKLEDVIKDNVSNAFSDEYASLSVEEQTDELRDILFDNLDLFDEDAYTFFYDDAQEQYSDSEDYRNNPYSYNGVSPRDFY